MTPLEIENRAGLSRATCGWKRPQLPLEAVRRYWRDVHSPAIARRAGVYDYRHFQFDAVSPALLPDVAGVDYACPAGQQLMWLSDVRYLDEGGLAAFGASPCGDVKTQLLGDIELIVDKSTTYRSVGTNTRTLIDRCASATPQGIPSTPAFGLFFRARAPEAEFRSYLRSLAQRWAQAAGIVRLRFSLFDVPDMEAERKAGYPIKTHPLDQQYQAWIDLVLTDERAFSGLLGSADAGEFRTHVRAVHAYPVAQCYTFNYGGLPTLVGLRGFAAWSAIEDLGGNNHKDPGLLTWMYGPVVSGGSG